MDTIKLTTEPTVKRGQTPKFGSALGALVHSSFRLYFYDQFADAMDILHIIPGSQVIQGRSPI